MHSPRPAPGWWLLRLVIGVIAIAILVGCGAVDYPQTTLFPRSDNNQVINDLYAP